MCTQYRKPITEKVKKEFEKSGKLIGYKVVMKRSYPPLFPNTFQSYNFSHIWEKGVNHSTRVSTEELDSRELTPIEHATYEIIKGFHVFLSMKSAQLEYNRIADIYGSNNVKILEVECSRMDFVAAGIHNSFETAVFTDVWVK
jgi:hypothetical protein